MLRPSFQRRIPPTDAACLGGSLIPNMNIMPLIRWTSRSPASPVPYSFQQRQRAKMLGSKARLGTVPCQVSQSSVRGDRSGGGGYSHAPLGSLRPSHPSTSIRRSEEHTSELQSPCNLVCRLLHEKKKSPHATQLFIKPLHRNAHIPHLTPPPP